MRESVLTAVCLLTLPVVLGLAVVLAIWSDDNAGNLPNEGSTTCYTAPGSWATPDTYIPGSLVCPAR